MLEALSTIIVMFVLFIFSNNYMLEAIQKDALNEPKPRQNSAD